MTETFYDLLGIAPDADTEDVEAAYREAIKEAHPDVSDDADAGDRTKRLNEARAVLTDDAERARYDRLGHERYVNGTDRGRSTDPDRSAAEGDDNGDASGNASSPAGTTGRRSARSSGPRGRGRRANTERARERRRATGGTSSDRTPGDRTSSDRSTDARTKAERATGTRTTSGRAADGAHGAAYSKSARRQATAGTGSGPNLDGSWNGWERTRAWAVREGTGGGRGLRIERLFPPDQSVVLLASAFLLYPAFVASVLFPPFPLVFRFVIGVCTVFMLVYLFTIPEVALLIFGLWSALVTVAIVAIPSLTAFSVVGLVGLSATWLPLGLAALMLPVVRP